MRIELDSHTVKRKFFFIEGYIKHSSIALIIFATYEGNTMFIFILEETARKIGLSSTIFS
jgi:hypothetical protein